MGRAFAVCAAFALVTGPYLGCGCFRPDDRPAGTGSFRAAGNRFPDAGQYRHAGKLAAGEYALLQSGEFSWVSLNFLDGRLELEAAEAKPVPDIAAGTLHGLRAKVAGTVVSTNLVSGTMLVVPGQAVEKARDSSALPGLNGTVR